MRGSQAGTEQVPPLTLPYPAPYVRIASSSTNQNNLAGGQSDGIQIGIRNVDSEIL